MFHQVLVAIDSSAIGRRVFEAALAVAKATGASLMLLHVLSSEEKGSPPVPIFSSWEYSSGLSGGTLEIYQEQWETFEERGLALLRSYQESATAAGVITEFTQNSGSPGRTICQLAQSWKADLIVIGRRGHSGFNELLLGSVSNYVLHHAPCSVLTVQHLADSKTEAAQANQVASEG